MDRHELRGILTELLEETTGESHPNVTENMTFGEGLGLDSVDMFSLVVELQSKFDIRIQSSELVTIGTVGQLLDLLQGKLSPQSASNAA